ncbi:MAG: Crp/Fnr family transcriptional regulator [Gammaproteobacteria bacterium]|nr:MAG: Crp/Fnr family transcriptional regulator [Gammaproteobacteria bacterium]
MNTQRTAPQGALPLQTLFETYPELDEQIPEWHQLLEQATVLELPAGNMLVRQGTCCSNFMLLLEGTVRVFQISDDGREQTLYRINPGDICLMSLSSLINDKPFKANAITDSPVRALVLSTTAFHEAMAISESFRNLVMRSLVNTVCEMMHGFYDTAFEPLDMRLACLLGRMFERAGTSTITITHQQLAQELGTSREVVSRILKRLERENCLRLSRGRITVNDPDKLPG